MDSDVKWLVTSRRNGARCQASCIPTSAPQLVLWSDGGTGKRRIAAHDVVFISAADVMVVSSMTNEGNVWLGVQGNPQKALMTLHRF